MLLFSTYDGSHEQTLLVATGLVLLATHADGAVGAWDEAAEVVPGGL